jgi:hypothetical protein
MQRDLMSPENCEMTCTKIVRIVSELGWINFRPSILLQTLRKQFKVCRLELPLRGATYARDASSPSEPLHRSRTATMG